MKKINILSILLLLIMSLASCESWIDPVINEDPNNPLDIPMDFLVPAIQTNMAYDLSGNDAVRTTNIWMQYFDGVDRQSLAEAQFNYTPADCNNLWNSNYGGTGKDIYILIEKASELSADGDPKSVYTRGMAKVMMAELMSFNTNFWNDVPYSEAFLGDSEGITSPILDTQEAVYAAIDQLLADAIVDLLTAESILPIPSDMIYGGDEGSWLATAWALRARYSIMLSKRNGATAYSNALTYAQNALDEGFAGYVFASFTTDASGMNPLAQFMRDRSGDLVMCSTLIDMLVTDSDPRLAFYSDGNVGSPPTSQTTEASLPGTYAAGADAAIYHMNLAELYFIQAEAYPLNSTDAFTAYNNGVAASLVDVVGSSATLPDNLAPDAASLTLEEIIRQKYIANYATVQGFNDWRRTGYPNLTVPVNAIRDEIPRRYPYPLEEVTYNSNVSSEGITLSSRVWWDQ